MMEAIRRLFEEHVPMSDDDWAFFSSRLVPCTYAKGRHLLQVMECENYLSYVEEGILRLYLPGEENDTTFGFVFAGEFVSAYDSFLTRQPSTYAIQALSPARIWQIHYQDLQDVYRQTACGEQIGRKNAEQLFLQKSKRELSLLTQNAAERYQALFHERPDLIRHIPLKYIASYIGVTPQALSRIRRRVIS